MPATAGRRGVILVGVLWVLVFLAFLAIVLRLHLSGIADSVRVTEDKAAGRILAEAALSHAAATVRAAAASDGQMPDRMGGTVELASGSVNYRMANEALRVDLNTGAEPLIVGALRAAGASAAQARTLADRILSGRDENGGENGGAPEQALDEPTIVYKNTREIALESGMPQALSLALERYVTVSSGLDGIRLQEAAPELLDAISELPRTHRRAIALYRQGETSFEELMALLGELEYHSGETAASWRVEMDVELVSGYSERYEAVIMTVSQDIRPYRVLEWRRLDGEGG
jgi:general secretion pathway protein K